MTHSNNPPEGFGECIGQLRRRKGWSQEELAKRTGTTRVQIGKYEREANEPNLGLLSRIAKALETTTDFLICGEPVRSQDGGFLALVTLLESCSAELRDALTGFVRTLPRRQLFLCSGDN